MKPLNQRGAVPLLTLIEMVVALAVTALLLVAMIRAYGILAGLESRLEADEALLPATQAKIEELEAAPAEESEGSLARGWRYQTTIQDGRYILTVRRTDGSARYTYLLTNTVP
jgi:Tfp pilus assembly protein PilE